MLVIGLKFENVQRQLNFLSMKSIKKIQGTQLDFWKIFMRKLRKNFRGMELSSD